MLTEQRTPTEDRVALDLKFKLELKLPDLS